MPIARPPIPLPDYQRIFRVLKTVLDGVEANTAHSCVFFSVAGAYLVEQVYKKQCQPVAGAAFYLMDDDDKTVLSFADPDDGHDDLSSDNGFHCWILCDNYIIDFMAPLFQESLQSKGFTGECSRKMFQKPRNAMVDSPLLMRKPGDFYMLPNVRMTRKIMEKFLLTAGNQELLTRCMHWYKKPPKAIPHQVSVENNDGSITHMSLSDISLVGVW